MRHTFRRSLTLAITVVCVLARTTSTPARSMTEREELDTWLARYDREPDGPIRDGLAAHIDAIAHQKYATVSRLYWYVDLESAKAAARAQGRPILHLRMLGSLEDDLSCANSRLFRATLYANRDLSEFLRQRFVLSWSSERPVPHVTIDYGDGRRLERTTAGNSAHYILDEHGNVLDVLPGLYAPTTFRHELEGSLALAARVRDKSNAERASVVADYHRERVATAEREWARVAATPSIPTLRQLPTPPTVSKMAIERRDLRVFAKRLAPEAVSEDQIEVWSAAGQLLYGAGGPVLDDASRALVARLHNAGPQELRATDQGLRAILARLEQTIVADTALNQLRLRPQISREIVRGGGRISFPTLNDWIQRQVFRTPREDAWLGLLQRDVFTGLPGDGVVLRGTR
jgi:hypothetical protein